MFACYYYFSKMPTDRRDLQGMDMNREAGGMIKQISEALERDCNNNMRKTGMTLSQFNILMPLGGHPEGAMTLKEIERMLHCAQSTAHGLVTRLEEKGLVTSSGDPQDKRIRVVRITDKGRGYCKAAKADMQDMDVKLLEPLDRSEREKFLDFLSRIRDALV